VNLQDARCNNKDKMKRVSNYFIHTANNI